MQNFADNVHNEIAKLVPAIVDDIACFVFYDDHPVQRKFCDITICTKHGEVKEYYKREEVSSLLLRSNFKATRISILRNNKCQLFYLVASDHEVVILSRKNELKVHQRVSNMEYYDVDDYGYNGQASLKIVQKDDAVPLIFDDNFQNLGEQALFMNGINVDESVPVLIELKRKLTQAQYSVACNEKNQKKLNDLRKLATFAAYQKIHPTLDNSMFQQNYKQAVEGLKIQSKSPSVKIYNSKFVIVSHAINKHKEALKDVTVFLHAKNKPSMVYTTRLFQHRTESPFWKETTQELLSDMETAIAVVVDFTELQYSVTSKIEFDGAISYRRMDKESLLPLDYVMISYSEAMGKVFDVLANKIDEFSILTIMAATKRVDLSLRIIRDVGDDPKLPLPSLFCLYLGMEPVDNLSNIVIHKNSSHHVLNGVMIIFENDETASHTYYLAVHCRSPGQVLTLIHYIYDAFPFRVIVTSKNHKITSTVDALSMYKEEMPKIIHLKLNYVGYAVSILKLSEMILEYLDGCMIKMNYSKNTVIQSKVGKEVDLFADGLSVYMEFRTRLLKEALRGIEDLTRNPLNPPNVAQFFQDNE